MINGYGPIVVDWTYKYNDGKQNETDDALSNWFQYYRAMGEFDNGVLSFIFAHIEGGIRHVTIFSDPYSFIRHAENTLNSPYYESGSQLYQDWAE